MVHLYWKNNRPISADFNDCYYSLDGGLAEAEYVFLEGNQLPQRWREIKNSDDRLVRSFHLCELGFGTGLNFCATVKSFLEEAAENISLCYLACEKYPLSTEQIERALTVFPAISPYYEELLRSYSLLPAMKGFQRLVLQGGRVLLTLFFGEASSMCCQINSAIGIEAWFLDGFAPAKNPSMWQPEIFEQMARLSSSEATFATFSVAGVVRRRLEQNGFLVKKRAGFGRKREMLTGKMAASSTTENEAYPAIKNSLLYPKKSYQKNLTKIKRDLSRQGLLKAAVIGGGLAGSAVAEALARRGFQVWLIEQNSSLAQGASAQPVAILQPLITKKPTTHSRLIMQGYHYMLHHLERMYQLKRLKKADQKRSNWQNGVLQLAPTEELQERFQLGTLSLPPTVARPVDREEATALSALECSCGGVYFPKGCALSPVEICRANCAQRGIEQLFRRKVRAPFFESRSKLWKVYDRAGRLIVDAPFVILANAFDVLQFELCRKLPLRRVRGQSFALPKALCHQEPGSIISGDVYLIAGEAETHFVGATFEPWNNNPIPEPEQNCYLFKKLTNYLPRLIPDPTLELPLSSTSGLPLNSTSRLPLNPTSDLVIDQVSGEKPISQDYKKKICPQLFPTRVCFRITTADHLPATGRLNSWPPGLFISVAHGSRGLIYTHLCAEILAAQICQEILPVEEELALALSPQRFIGRSPR